VSSQSIRITLLLFACVFGTCTVSAAAVEGLGCVAHGTNLDNAKAHYATQCSEPRVDCDPHDGRWFCASFTINKSTPQYIFNLEQTRSTSADSITAANPPIFVNEPHPDLPQHVVQPEHNTSDSTENLDASDESSSLAPEPIKTPTDITDLILITGQSNALGANTSYDAVLDKPHEQVFAYTDKGWQVANLKQVWDLNWFPRTHPGSDPSNNLALHFAKQFVTSHADRTVGFVLATAPGQAIEHWRYQGTFYRKVESKVLDAINQLPHKSTIDGVLWHQGETDANDTQDYTDALYTLIYYLRTEPWAVTTLPFICGETAQLAINNRLNGLNRDTDPYPACVRGSDLSTSEDGHHFDAAGLRTLGSRYADAYSNMISH